MMVNLSGIVLIDDNEEELGSLHQSLTQLGCPCLPIHYQKNEPDNQSGIDHVNLGNIHPRIILTDLNLQALQKIEAPNLVGPIAEVLKKVTPEGPYILLFWSKNKEEVDPVIKLLEERFSEDFKFPLHWGVVDKVPFLTNPDLTQLGEKVQSLLDESSICQALFDWENRIAKAAQYTTDSLYKLAVPESKTTIEQFKEEVSSNLNTILSLIGNETLGAKNAKEEPEVAIEHGLAPVLFDHVETMMETLDRSLWRDVASKTGTRIESQERFKAHLNSFYHVDESFSESEQKEKRGTWVELNSNYFEDSDNSRKIKLNLGRDLKTIIDQEFINTDTGSKAERKKLRDNLKLGFLELSAECDQAQRKTKLHRYFLAALIPKEYEKFTLFRDDKSPSKHAGIYRLPNLLIQGNEYIVKISFMYQLGTIPDSSKWFGKPMFRLKDQILNDISFKASQHASRPGIIRFD